MIENIFLPTQLAFGYTKHFIALLYEKLQLIFLRYHDNVNTTLFILHTYVQYINFFLYFSLLSIMAKNLCSIKNHVQRVYCQNVLWPLNFLNINLCVSKKQGPLQLNLNLFSNFIFLRFIIKNFCLQYNSHQIFLSR